MHACFSNKEINKTPAARYAPSPTGPLHLGNLSTAWHAFKLAKQYQLDFILRIEDIDEIRCHSEYEQSIIDDLKKLGIEWQQFYRQSERTSLYQQAFDYLQKQSLVYPCYCSRKEIAFTQSHQQANVYPGTCRYLSKQKQIEKSKSHDPSWRFNSEAMADLLKEKGFFKEKNNDSYTITPSLTVCFYDDWLKQSYQYDCLQHGGDFIIKRKDGFFAYQLAVVVDDILMNIRQVCRGQDLLDNTPWQILLYHALGHSKNIPNYFHLPLLLNKQGQKLSKRNKDHDLSHWLNQPLSANAKQKHSISSLINGFEKFQLPDD